MYHFCSDPQVCSTQLWKGPSTTLLCISSEFHRRTHRVSIHRPLFISVHDVMPRTPSSPHSLHYSLPLSVYIYIYIFASFDWDLAPKGGDGDRASDTGTNAVYEERVIASRGDVFRARIWRDIVSVRD